MLVHGFDVDGGQDQGGANTTGWADLASPGTPGELSPESAGGFAGILTQETEFSGQAFMA
jgi:hypothetical protein